jgi:hypothetical protein
MHNSNIASHCKLNTLQNIYVSAVLKDPTLDFVQCNLFHAIPATQWLLGTSTSKLSDLPHYTRLIMFWVQAAVSSQLTYGTFKLTINTKFITVVLCKRSYVNPSRIWVAKHWPTYDILRSRRLLTNVIVDIHIHPEQNTPRSHTFTSNVNMRMSANILIKTPHLHYKSCC